MPRFLHLQLHLLVGLYATSAFRAQDHAGRGQLVAWRTLIAALGAAALAGTASPSRPAHGA